MKMDYELWDLICHVLEFDVDDEAAYDLRRAAPWKIITGMRDSVPQPMNYLNILPPCVLEMIADILWFDGVPLQDWMHPRTRHWRYWIEANHLYATDVLLTGTCCTCLL